MLSKAEIQYLQGQKRVSKSYEMNLKCLIRKKLEVLHEELPLIANLFTGNTKSVFSENLIEGEGPSLTSIPKEGVIENFRYLEEQIAATELGNTHSRDEFVKVHRDVREGPESSKDSSNALQISDPTKISNSDENRRRERDLNPRGPHGPQAI